jgi:hypothetical protein
VRRGRPIVLLVSRPVEPPIFNDAKGSLELLRASDSLRWSGMHKLKAEDDGATAIPDDESAAKAYASTRAPQVTRAELSVIDAGKKPETKLVAVHVNYRYELNGLSLFGPGAKTCVTLGGKSEVLECYQFWRAAKQEGEGH